MTGLRYIAPYAAVQPRYAQRSQRGITLVEMMIALVLGSVITLGVFRIVEANRSLSALVTSLGAVQDNARTALELIKRDIRSADYLGCINTVYLSNIGTYLLSGLPPVDLALSAGAFSVTFDQPYTINVPATREAPAHTLTRTTDRITIQSFEPIGDGRLATGIVGAGFQIPLQTDISTNDVLLITNCDDDANIFQPFSINHDISTQRTVIEYTDPTVLPIIGMAEDFTTDDRIYQVVRRSYYVKQNSEGRGSLFYQEDNDPEQELVPNVESMQVALGIDSNNDGRVDSYQNTAPASWSSVLALQIEMMLSDPANDVIDTDSMRAIKFGALVGGEDGPVDRHLRRVFRQHIDIRSRIPL